MGTWGVGAFENDEAADWSLEFENADLEGGLKLIRDALNFEGAGTEGIQELTEMVAVAAADLVIRINGHAVPAPPDTHHLDEIVVDEDAEDDYEFGGFGGEAMKWIARTHPASYPSLTDLARRAVARVKGPGSGLADLWDEAFDPADTPIWRSYMAELAAKLAEEPVRPS
jgi:hypothetical protein